jgi:hypothetical protein
VCQTGAHHVSAVYDEFQGAFVAAEDGVQRWEFVDEVQVGARYAVDQCEGYLFVDEDYLDFLVLAGLGFDAEHGALFWQDDLELLLLQLGLFDEGLADLLHGGLVHRRFMAGVFEFLQHKQRF